MKEAGNVSVLLQLQTESQKWGFPRLPCGDQGADSSYGVLGQAYPTTGVAQTYSLQPYEFHFPFSPNWNQITVQVQHQGCSAMKEWN